MSARRTGVHERRAAAAMLVALALLIVLSGCDQKLSTGSASAGAKTPHPDGWTSVTCGGATMALQSDGVLWAWGSNEFGQLGLGTTSSTLARRPTQVGGAGWATVACGQYATAAIKTDGTLLTWGRNHDHELGLGTFDTRDRSTPTQVGSDHDWASVSCGSGIINAPETQGFALAIKRDGTLWGWGANDAAELGLGDTRGRSRPTRVGSDSDWATVSCGPQRALAIKRDGTLWGWGDSLMGELGLGEVGGADTPRLVGSAHDWAAVSCGESFTIALKKDGTLWVTGYDVLGALGLSGVTKTLHFTRVGVDTDWTSISAGQSSVLALKRGGSIWVWGFNGDGELGLGDRRRRSVPTRQKSGRNWVSIATGSQSAGIKGDGSLWTWGWNVDRPARVQ